MQLPQPDAESAAHSRRVADYIHARIDEAGGAISFAEYMHHALYAPGLGYYAAGATKFGAAGDFVTAPEVSSLFGKIVAGQCTEVLEQLGSGSILEFGAGSGRLARDILQALAARDALPEGGYRILEVSPDLRERQAAFLKNEIPEIAGIVSWIDQFPAQVSGVILANEVLDAFPVERFVKQGDKISQICVAADDQGFVLTERTAPDPLAIAVAHIETTLGRPLPSGYVSEVCLAAPIWIADVATALQKGALLLFDYGLSRREYYARDRSGGWLRCHFRHHAHNEPLILPGIQDLTAWVDYTAIAEAGVDAGLEVLGFVSQAQFMIGGGVERIAAEFANLSSDARLKLSVELKLLTLPSEMGEYFKCLGLGRGGIATPPAFGHADRTASLG